MRLPKIAQRSEISAGLAQSLIHDTANEDATLRLSFGSDGDTVDNSVRPL